VELGPQRATQRTENRHVVAGGIAVLRHWPGPRGWRATAGRALGEETAGPLVLKPELSCHDMWGGLGGGWGPLWGGVVVPNSRNVQWTGVQKHYKKRFTKKIVSKSF
jgi:hypothetical protein